MQRIEHDKYILRKMITIYARHRCNDDASRQEVMRLAQYACNRLEHCRYGEAKPACKDCPIHCYAPTERQRIKMVMRWAGPRMILYSPRGVLRHLCQTLKTRLWGSPHP